MKRIRSLNILPEGFYSLNLDQGPQRAKWLLLFSGLLWVILSGLQVLIYFISKDQRSLFIPLFSFAKYIPLLIVPAFVARKLAAAYLTDIFELKDSEISERFITSLAFGSGYEHITIDENRIFVDDMGSTILHIGGPGVVHVHLDNAALTEKLNGEPHVLTAQAAPWVLEGFERLREIGLDTDSEEYRFAIIDLKDQFVRDLAISTRTKDGIPIRAEDIKIIFSVQRKHENGMTEEPHSVTDEAIHAIVYKQTVLVGSPNPTYPSLGFPWDSTILPLILGELENVIMQSTLSEILANIGQKELEQTKEAETQINRLKSELTGQQHPVPRAGEAPEFQSRSKLTARFYEPSFQKKASDIGVHLIWIDIGTWKLPSSIIIEKHKEAWELSGQNNARKAGIERKRILAQQRELLQLIDDVVFSKFEKTPLMEETVTLKSETLELKRYPERSPLEIAKDILRGFRKELLAARSMLDKREIYNENKETIEGIQNAVKEIIHFTGNDDTNNNQQSPLP